MAADYCSRISCMSPRCGVKSPVIAVSAISWRLAHGSAENWSREGHFSTEVALGMPKSDAMMDPSGELPCGITPGVVDRGQAFDASKINYRRIAYDVRLDRVNRFVDQHYADPLTLEKVANVAGLEKSYFSRYFHKKTGVCYHDWLHWIRVNHAIDLMRSHEVTITEIAFAVGYQDLRTFERAFDKCTGQCPKAMKKKVISDLHS